MYITHLVIPNPLYRCPEPKCMGLPELSMPFHLNYICTYASIHVYHMIFETKQIEKNCTAKPSMKRYTCMQKRN